MDGTFARLRPVPQRQVAPDHPMNTHWDWPVEGHYFVGSIQEITFHQQPNWEQRTILFPRTHTGEILRWRTVGGDWNTDMEILRDWLDG